MGNSQEALGPPDKRQKVPISRRVVLSKVVQTGSAIATGVLFPPVASVVMDRALSMPSTVSSIPQTREVFVRGVANEIFSFLRTPRASADTLSSLPPSSISVENDPAVISEMTNIMRGYGNGNYGAPDTIGYRTSNAWKGPDGFWYMSYQGAILQQRDKKDIPAIWNLLDNAHDMGLDAKLDDGTYGVTVPPKEDFDDRSGGDMQKAFDARVTHFNVPPNVVDFVNKMRSVFETGAFTSHGKNYGPYTVYRTQRMAFQEWTDGPKKGIIERILVGDAAKQAGLVPKSAQLAQPDTANLFGEGGLGSDPLIEGDLRRDGIIFYNDPRAPVLLKIKDPDVLGKVIGQIAREAHPNGVEVFNHYLPLGDPGDGPVPLSELGTLQQSLQDYKFRDLLLAGTMPSVLQNTGSVEGIGPNGTFQIHISLSPNPHNNHPTPFEIEGAGSNLDITLLNILAVNNPSLNTEIRQLVPQWMINTGIRDPLAIVIK